MAVMCAACLDPVRPILRAHGQARIVFVIRDFRLIRVRHRHHVSLVPARPGVVGAVLIVRAFLMINYTTPGRGGQSHFFKRNSVRGHRLAPSCRNVQALAVEVPVALKRARSVARLASASHAHGQALAVEVPVALKRTLSLGARRAIPRAHGQAIPPSMSSPRMYSLSTLLLASSSRITTAPR